MPTKQRKQQRVARLTEKVVGAVREDLAGRGFSLIQTPAFFDEDLFLRLPRSKTVLPFDSKRWAKLPQLARYACWLEQILSEALPDEAVTLATLEFRHEEPATADAVTDRLHIDGSYIRATCTLYGRPTFYFEDEIARPVPEGQTLLMTAVNRTRMLGIPATLHRRPGVGPERGVIVCSMEPRLGDETTDLYWQVGEAPRPRRRK